MRNTIYRFTTMSLFFLMMSACSSTSMMVDNVSLKGGHLGKDVEISFNLHANSQEQLPKKIRVGWYTHIYINGRRVEGTKEWGLTSHSPLDFALPASQNVNVKVIHALKKSETLYPNEYLIKPISVEPLKIVHGFKENDVTSETIVVGAYLRNSMGESLGWKSLPVVQFKVYDIVSIVLQRMPTGSTYKYSFQVFDSQTKLPIVGSGEVTITPKKVNSSIANLDIRKRLEEIVIDRLVDDYYNEIYEKVVKTHNIPRKEVHSNFDLGRRIYYNYSDFGYREFEVEVVIKKEGYIPLEFSLTWNKPKQDVYMRKVDPRVTIQTEDPIDVRIKDSRSMKDRLQSLKQLFDSGLISEQEYNARRKAILDEL